MLYNLQLYINFLQYPFQVKIQFLITFYNENNKNDKIFFNNSNFSDYDKFCLKFSKFYGNSNLSGNDFRNSNITMGHANDTEIIYIFFAFGNNNLSNFSIISQQKKNTYVVDVICKGIFL